MDILLIFIKTPVLGSVKTRLATTIGDEKALVVYQKLLELTRCAALNSEAENWVYYSTEIVKNDLFSTPEFKKKRQLQTPDLGERMKSAFADAFAAGAKRVVIIGSDCPELTSIHLWSMFDALQNVALTICPTEDGGYAALGMREFMPELFDNIEWSTNRVYTKTIEHFTNITKQNAKSPYFCSLNRLRDLDDYDDYLYYQKTSYNVTF